MMIVTCQECGRAIGQVASGGSGSPGGEIMPTVAELEVYAVPDPDDLQRGWCAEHAPVEELEEALRSQSPEAARRIEAAARGEDYEPLPPTTQEEDMEEHFDGPDYDGPNR